MSSHLGENHRNTLRQITDHPTSSNVEWHDVLSLLRTVGDVTVEHNSKVKITVGTETIVVSPPRQKTVDEDLLVELRHLLRAAEYAPAN
ncbi:MAG: hypothetical protein IJG47_06070 [Microbacterium sp.]|nr:hypothetical protein [Microbacterium sp.]